MLAPGGRLLRDDALATGGCGSPCSASQRFSEPLGDHLHLYTRRSLRRAARRVRVRRIARPRRSAGRRCCASRCGRRRCGSGAMRILIDTTYARRAPHSGTAVYLDRLIEALSSQADLEVVPVSNRAAPAAGRRWRAQRPQHAHGPLVGGDGAAEPRARRRRRRDPPPAAGDEHATPGRQGRDHRPRPRVRAAARACSTAASGATRTWRTETRRSRAGGGHLRLGDDRARRARAVGRAGRAHRRRAARSRPGAAERAASGGARALPVRRRRASRARTSRRCWRRTSATATQRPAIRCRWCSPARRRASRGRDPSGWPAAVRRRGGARAPVAVRGLRADAARGDGRRDARDRGARPPAPWRCAARRRATFDPATGRRSSPARWPGLGATACGELSEAGRRRAAEFSWATSRTAPPGRILSSPQPMKIAILGTRGIPGVLQRFRDGRRGDRLAPDRARARGRSSTAARTWSTRSCAATRAPRSSTCRRSRTSTSTRSCTRSCRRSTRRG